MGRHYTITDKEREVLEAWMKHGGLLAAAEALKREGKVNHISTVYGRIDRLKSRYQKAKGFMRDYERWARMLPSPLEVV